MEYNNYGTVDGILLKNNWVLLFIGKNHEYKYEGFEHAGEWIGIRHILNMME